MKFLCGMIVLAFIGTFPTYGYPVSEYRVEVTTGDVAGAGTDANVYITIYGTWPGMIHPMATKEHVLDNSGHDDNERGQHDTFWFNDIDVSYIDGVRIRHDNSGEHPGWFLKSITVTERTMDKYGMNTWHRRTFDCNCWLAKDEGDGSIDRTLCPNNNCPNP